MGMLLRQRRCGSADGARAGLGGRGNELIDAVMLVSDRLTSILVRAKVRANVGADLECTLGLS